MTRFPYDPPEQLGSNFFTKRRSLEDAANRVGPARTALATGAPWGMSSRPKEPQLTDIQQPFTLNEHMRARIEARRKAAADLKAPRVPQPDPADSQESERDRVDGYIKSLMQHDDYWQTGPATTTLKDTVQKLWQTAYPNPARTGATGRPIQDEEPAVSLNELITIAPARTEINAHSETVERASNSNQLFTQTVSETEEPPDHPPTDQNECEALQAQYLELRQIEEKFDKKRSEHTARVNELTEKRKIIKAKIKEALLSLAPPVARTVLDIIDGEKSRTPKKDTKSQIENILALGSIAELEKERIDMTNEIEELNDKIKIIDDKKKEINNKKGEIQTKSSDIKGCIILDS
jgi:hypothetical protein